MLVVEDITPSPKSSQDDKLLSFKFPRYQLIKLPLYTNIQADELQSVEVEWKGMETRGCQFRRRTHLRGNAEPLQVLHALDGNAVPHACSQDSLQVRAVDRLGVPAEGRVLEHLGGRVIAEDAGPLLDLLLQVLWVERRVFRPVVLLNPGVRAGVAGVHGADGGCPLRSGSNGLAECTGRVPGVDAVGAGDEATSCDAGVDGRGHENVGVGGGKDVGHHS